MLPRNYAATTSTCAMYGDSPQGHAETGFVSRGGCCDRSSEGTLAIPPSCSPTTCAASSPFNWMRTEQSPTLLIWHRRCAVTCAIGVPAAIRLARLRAVISSPVHWKLASLPRALKPDEVERLLNGFTSACRWPKRSYAIGRCALDLGLRAGEIAHLMIPDIDWRAGTVTLKGTKSLRQDVCCGSDYSPGMVSR